ncbi:MAG: DUF4863 family protein [Sandaracinaceae bacterium]
MSYDRASLDAALAPLLAVIRELDPSDPEKVTAELNARFALDSEPMRELRAIVRTGVEARWLAERDNDGVRYGRVIKATSDDMLSVDCVHMRSAGVAHTHPNGEIDLLFEVEGEPTFDGHAPGWAVYAPGSWHVPRVDGGSMDILYFLPGGAIRFEAEPSATRS